MNDCKESIRILIKDPDTKPIITNVAADSDESSIVRDYYGMHDPNIELCYFMGNDIIVLTEQNRDTPHLPANFTYVTEHMAQQHTIYGRAIFIHVTEQGALASLTDSQLELCMKLLEKNSIAQDEGEDERQSGKMRVLVKKPCEKPVIAYIEKDENMNSIRAAMGWKETNEPLYLEPLYAVGRDIVLLVDEDGIRKKLPYNFTMVLPLAQMGKMLIYPRHALYGTAVFIGTKGEEFEGLTDEQIKISTEMFVFHNLMRVTR